MPSTASGFSKLDLAPPKAWRRFFPKWLRSLVWGDSAVRYDAFLSYSWKSDKEVARVIQSVLQRYLCPWYKLRAKTIFRDLDCMPAGSDLKREFCERIDRSEHFILLACPSAARSAGMEMEAQHWFSRSRPGKTLIIVTDGKFKSWEDMRQRLLPPAVKANLANEPVWTSLEDCRSGILKSPDDRKLRRELVQALQQVFLCLYEPKTWEQLQGEERAQRRRAVGMIATVVLVFLFGSLVAGSVVGYERALARCRQYVASSISYEDTNPELAVLLAAHAMAATWPWGHMVLPEAEDQLHRAITASHLSETLRGHSSRVWSVAWSPDGQRLATGSHDGTARVWDISNRKDLLVLGRYRGPPVASVAWGPDGKRLATGAWDGTAKIWDAISGQELVTLRGTAPFSSVAWSPDGKRLATGGAGGTATVWDAGSGQALLRLTGHRAIVSVVAWSPDGTRLATGGHDNTAKIWDATTGKEMLSVTLEYGVDTVAWSPDGKRLAIGDSDLDDNVKVWDATSGKELLRLRGHIGNVSSVAWSPDGMRLATGSFDSTARVWDAATGKELLTLRGHTGYVLSVSWSPDGKRLATGAWDGTAKIWDGSSGPELLTWRGHGPFCRWRVLEPGRQAASDHQCRPDGHRMGCQQRQGVADSERPWALQRRALEPGR